MAELIDKNENDIIKRKNKWVLEGYKAAIKLNIIDLDFTN